MSPERAFEVTGVVTALPLPLLLLFLLLLVLLLLLLLLVLFLALYLFLSLPSLSDNIPPLPSPLPPLLLLVGGVCIDEGSGCFSGVDPCIRRYLS